MKSAKNNLFFRFFTLIVAFCICFGITNSVTAFAAEEVTPYTYIDTSGKRVYYPDSGSSSGAFKGKYSQTLTYSYLDAGKSLTIYYMFEGGSSAKLIFKKGSLSQTIDLEEDGQFHDNKKIVLPNSGPWDVYIEVNDNNTTTTRYFAFDIYWEK